MKSCEVKKGISKKKISLVRMCGQVFFACSYHNCRRITFTVSQLIAPVLCGLFPTPEVTLKVHVSDASTHQPISDALIEIFTNQVSVASGTSGIDGVAFVKFQYKLGSQLMVTASKQAYVPNSAPWKPIRLPGEALLVLLAPSLSPEN